MSPSVYEFFAGGGMARAGLGEHWTTLFANDIDEMKAEAYARNWGDNGLVVKDVAKVSADELPGRADLAWASFPCQDLSLAGAGRGLGGTRSGTFWPFWRLMEQLDDAGRAPSVIALENVYGAVRSHGGKDFRAIADAFAQLDYRVGAFLIDAKLFVPQSRLRLFVVGVKRSLNVPEGLVDDAPKEPWHPKPLREAVEGLSQEARAAWRWWSLPTPTGACVPLESVIEDEPKGVDWDAPEKTDYLLSLMSSVNLDKVVRAKASGHRQVGTVYRRTRRDADGKRVQRAEVRFDGLSGCLRTPSGGSSRQTILVVDGTSVRSRLLSTREAARLMGLPDAYLLPERYNAAYHLAGDGVAVPVVRHLAQHLIEPIVALSSHGVRQPKRKERMAIRERIA